MSALISFGITLDSSGIIILPIDGIVTDVVIDWDDGNTSPPISYINPSHTYNSTGSYTISILSGSFTELNTNETNDLFQSSLTSFSYYTQIPELTNLNYAFYNLIRNFTIYFAPNVTNNVTTAIRMFYNASSFNKSLSNLDTSAVDNMSGMFRNAYAFNQSISNFNTSNVTNMSGMFTAAISFNQPVSNFNTSSVTTMINMFSGAISFNQPVSNFNTSAVHRMSSMFYDATAFNQSLSHFDISNLSIASDMLTNSGLSSTNYNNLLTSWAAQAPNIKLGVPLGAYPIQYTSLSAQSARNTLTNTYNWSITDGGANIPPEPTISSISPSSGPISGGTYVTIKGTNFINGNTTVTFGGTSVNVFFYTSTQLTVITPANSAGSVNVVVTTNGGSATRNNGFTYQTLTISTIHPSFGYTSGGTYVTITGTNFHNPLTVQFGSNNFGTVSDISPDGTTINVTTPSNLNTGNVNVIITSDDGSVTQNNGFVYAPAPCFHEDTQILTNNGYIPIKNLKKGDLIQTLNHAFVPISIIGHSQLYNPGNEERTKDRLYKCTKDAYPEITEDLILTGMHAILVNNYSNQVENKKNKKMANGNRKIENKCCLLACVDERTIPYNVEGTYTIYNLALENEDINYQYGIYANGLLVETASQKYIKEMMTLIE